MTDRVTYDESTGAFNVDSIDFAVRTIDGQTTTDPATATTKPGTVTITFDATTDASQTAFSNYVEPAVKDGAWTLDKVRVSGDGSDTPTTDVLQRGGDVWYKVTIDNTSGTEAVPAASCITTDTFDNLTYVGYSTSGTNGAGTVTTTGTGGSTTVRWAPGDVAAGAQVSVWLHFTAYDAGMLSSVTNKVTANNRTDVVTDMQPDVTVAKDQVTPESDVVVGGPIQYTVTATNNGNASATNYVINDTATNLTYVGLSAIDSTGADVTGSVTYDNGKITISSIPGGGSVTITLDYTVGALPATNVASGTDSHGSYTLSKVRCDASGSTTSADATSALYAGDTIYYKVAVTNTSGITLSGIDVTDTPGTNLTYVRTVSTDSGTTSGTGPIVWTGWTAAPGATVTMLIECKVNADAVNSVKNTASTPTTTVITSDPVIDLTINKVEKSADDATSTWTITVTNNSTAAATNVEVAEQPVNLTYQSFTDAANLGITRAADGTFTIPSIPAGASVSFDVTFGIDGTPYTNGTKVVPHSDTDYNLLKSRVTDATGATAATDTVTSGQTVYYKVSLANTGATDIAAGTKVTDSFEGLTYTGADPAVAANTDGTLTWTAPAIATGETTSVVLSFTVNDGVSKITNAAMTPTHVVVVTDLVPQYEIDKVLLNGAAVTKVGDVATYELAVHNTNDVAGKDVKVIDAFTNLTMIGYSVGLDDGATTTVDYSNGVFDIASIPAGAVATITVNMTVDEFPITNKAATPQGDSQYALDKIRCDENGNAVPASDPVIAGDTIYYKVTVRNTSDTTLAPQTVTDIPGSGLMLDSVVSYVGASAVLASNAITWVTPQLLYGGSASMVIKASVAGTASGSVTNYAKTPDHETEVTIPVVPKTVDVAITKVQDTAAADVKTGGEITYTLTATNTGNTGVTNYVIDDVATGLTFKSAEATDGGGNAITVTPRRRHAHALLARVRHDRDHHGHLHGRLAPRDQRRDRH